MTATREECGAAGPDPVRAGYRWTRGYLDRVVRPRWHIARLLPQAGVATVAGVAAFSLVLGVLPVVLLGQTAALLGRVQRMAGTFRQLDELRAVVAGPVAATPDRSPPRRLCHGIELDGVDFRYPGTSVPVLRDVTLNLPAGATVALVGENGAGKSTLVKLLCGFYQPTSGRILVDGVDLERIAAPRWRRRVTACFQDFVRFEFLLREAVGVGDLARLDGAGDPAVRAAIERARAGDVLRGLPDGLDTLLGRSYADGAELSGGQWQKLALGRGFMREHPLLLVLDEPAAALDAEAEHALFARYAAQARRLGRRTGAVTLFVSHRFSTVQMADVVVVLGNGTVEQVGDHATLLRAGGPYADLYRLQSRAYV